MIYVLVGGILLFGVLMVLAYRQQRKKFKRATSLMTEANSDLVDLALGYQRIHYKCDDVNLQFDGGDFDDDDDCEDDLLVDSKH